MSRQATEAGRSRPEGGFTAIPRPAPKPPNRGTSGSLALWSIAATSARIGSSRRLWRSKMVGPRIARGSRFCFVSVLCLLQATLRMESARRKGEGKKKSVFRRGDSSAEPACSHKKRRPSRRTTAFLTEGV
jgi:hypothetical protein